MRGGFARAYTPADHPVVAYRKAIGAEALRYGTRKQWRSRLDGRGIRLYVWYVFQRPKSHLLASGKLKAGSPRYPRPDLDNLLKGVMDALTTAGVWEDDVAVTQVRARKRYVGSRIKPHTIIRIS